MDFQSWYYKAVVYDNEVYCNTCLPDDIGSEHAAPIFANEEWDTKPTCAVCGERHEYMRLSLHEALNLAVPDDEDFDR